MSRINDHSKLRMGIVVALVLTFSVLGMLVLSSGSVMAASLSISSDSITTDDGEIDGITVDASGDVTWDGAEEQPGDTTVKLQVQDADGDDWDTIDTVNEDLSGLAGTYSFSFSNVDVTDDTDWSESDFVSDDDGSSRDTQLNFRLVVESEGDVNGDGNNPDTATSNSAETTMTVINEESSTGFSASGEIDGEGTDEDPEDNENNGNNGG